VSREVVDSGAEVVKQAEEEKRGAPLGGALLL
jgi:hypothetical protein